MPKKKSKHTHKTLAQIQAELKKPKHDITMVSDAHPKIDDANNPDTKPFRWCFLSNNLKWNHKDFGWKCYCTNGGKGLKEFTEEIEQAVHDLYADKTFGQVSALPNCGYYGTKTLNDIQKNLLKDHIDTTQFQVYHIAITDKHRLIGYVENNMFYPILNDIEHQFSPRK